MTEIFLDSANPLETQSADRLLKSHGLPGVQGQTTNPSLLKKYIEGSETLKKKKLAHPDVLALYGDTVKAIAAIIRGPVSVQVIADNSTSADEMLTQARNYRLWIPNAVVKFPCTKTGLTAAEIFCREGPVNITLVFSQSQAAAAYAATKNRGTDPEGKPYDVFVSPFIGRLDDRGEKGMDIVANILAMYKAMGDGHIKVITSSIRNLLQLQYALKLNSPAATVPLSVLDEWAASGCRVPDDTFIYDPQGLTEIPYREIMLEDSWQAYDLNHDLTDSGVSKFYTDWQEIQAAH
jgi:transaldolase